MAFEIGLLLFDRLTQLDLTGPYEVFVRFPGARVSLIAHDAQAVTAEGGLRILPGTSFAECPPLDLVCVPGGSGVNRLLSDAPTLDFLRRQAQTARYVTSVCAGALALGAAGLLKGKRAATHWMSRDMLPAFGAAPSAERVTVDGNLITCGGVTAGIDLALVAGGMIFGEEAAKLVALAMEYDPHPPFPTGSPERAGEALVAKARAGAAARQTERKAAVEAAAAKLGPEG